MALVIMVCATKEDQDWIVLDIRGFFDANWAGDLDHRRSTSGYVFNLFRGAINWMSKKQSVVAISTTEAEYMVATHASKEAVWLQRLFSSMGLVKRDISIDCDSQSAISWQRTLLIIKIQSTLMFSIIL